MALKGILKNANAAAPAEAGPSKPRASKGATKPKATVKASVSASVAAPKSKSKSGKGKEKKTAKIAAPDSDEGEGDAEGSDVDMDGDDDELDTEDEIERANAPGEKKPLKRKRVTTASDFGSTLTSLLSEPVKPSKKKRATETEISLAKPAGQPILSLSAKPLPPSQAAVSLERRAARALKAEREERLDRARVRNVLEGWTPAPGADMGSQEFERALRKTAQRGVIKLFNAILIASKNAEAAAKTLSQKAGLKPEAPKSKKEKDNVLGRGGREDVLTKESFLDLVRKGGAK